MPACRPASAVRPICASVRSTRLGRLAVATTRRETDAGSRVPARLVIQRFSATVSLGNTLLICSVRLMPRRLISCGLRPVMSWPWKNTRPPVGGSRPETRLKNVVLPAPFGPMMACSREPAG